MTLSCFIRLEKRVGDRPEGQEQTPGQLALLKKHDRVRTLCGCTDFACVRDHDEFEKYKKAPAGQIEEMALNNDQHQRGSAAVRL